MGEIISIKYKEEEIEIDDVLSNKIMAILSSEWEKFDSPLQVKNS